MRRRETARTPDGRSVRCPGVRSGRVRRGDRAPHPGGRRGRRRAALRTPSAPPPQAARMRLPAALRGKVGESDVIQEAWLAAFLGLGGFEDRGDGSFARWLRGILDKKLADEVRTARDGEARPAPRGAAARPAPTPRRRVPARTSASEAAIGAEEAAVARGRDRRVCPRTTRPSCGTSTSRADARRDGAAAWAVPPTPSRSSTPARSPSWRSGSRPDRSIRAAAADSRSPDEETGDGRARPEPRRPRRRGLRRAAARGSTPARTVDAEAVIRRAPGPRAGAARRGSSALRRLDGAFAAGRADATLARRAARSARTGSCPSSARAAWGRSTSRPSRAACPGSRRARASRSR